MDKYRRFPDGDQAPEGEPRRRVLSRNFRSRPQVLLGCNDLFRNIMSTEFGELDYTDDQALVPGREFPQGEGYSLELDALDLSFLKGQEGERADKDLLEARFAARRIRTLLDTPILVEGERGLRPLRPSDIMILLRSPGPVLRHYARALGEEGIPWSADGGEDFFETTEVNVALAILRIVDNPRQDVPLIAALRSPVYGFTGDQLALIRGESDEDFYSALEAAAGRGDGPSRTFLDQLAQLRFGAGDRTCRQLISHIYETTNLLGIFGAMPGGKERQDNLLALYNLAGRLEDGGCRTLFQFLLRLDRLRETGIRFPAAGSNGEGDGVSILSIHRSKGLEKPVVLVCGLARRLNRDDLMRPVLFHPVLGVGPKGLDRERMIEYPTLARRAVARQLEREMMAEELRLLYVAMTRAREKLILTMALPEGTAVLERLGEGLTLPIPPMVLEQQQSVGQWVLLHALTRPEGEKFRALAGMPEVVARDLGPAWDLNWVEGQSLAEEQEQEGILSDVAGEDGEDLEGLEYRLGWEYPHRAGVDLPSKLTATQLKGRPLDREAEEGTPSRRRSGPMTRPNFMVEERGLTAAQRGTAIHLAMQYLPLNTEPTLQGVERELDRLLREGFLTEHQREAVPAAPLIAFLSSSLGRTMATSPCCRREFKFSLLVPAQEYFPGGEGEEILLQGVIDAWFEEGDSVTVVDFKSDRVSPGGEEARAEEYRAQLEAYSRALSAILGRPVGRRVLWFFATNTPVELGGPKLDE